MVTDKAEAQCHRSDFWQNTHWTPRQLSFLGSWSTVGSGPGAANKVSAHAERDCDTTEPRLSALFPAQSLANHLRPFSLSPGCVPTHCMMDLPFLKGFCLVHFVPSLLPPHNRTSHFHLAFKTSFALLGGRFRSTVMACKQIRYISTFLLSVRATQTSEIWRAQVFSNLLPMAR